ncbi:MAG: helix-turn-helix domain-containing protein, partial [Sulfuricellaceae bacterium]|nr:helix-turn-helix domain-containing protein [Sulfuricellaceae bacterium]
FLEDVLFLDVEARLAKRIMALARIYGRNYGASVHIDLKMSQQELANLVGISRESVNKYFKAWEKERVIASQQGCIVINQLQVLQSLAAGQ